jgi:heme exporter protein A
VGVSLPAIEASGLCRRFGPRWALVDVTFAVPAGARAILRGRNGSGKSTLLRVLATALRPDRGRGSVLGHDLRLAGEQVRRASALVTHQTFLYESLSALDNLALVASFRGEGASRDQLVETLAAVGLAERADDPPESFSAGMRRRLALARLLLQRPAVAFLDEPYAQLDAPGADMVDGILDRFHADGVTVLMATHHRDPGAAAGDLTLALEDGRLVS